MDKMNSNIKIYLRQGKDLVVLPVNPEKLAISEKSKNKEKTVLGVGDVNIPDVRGLNSLSFDAFFPAYWGHYCSVGQAELFQPIYYVNKIMTFKNRKEPVKITFGNQNMQKIMLANGNTSGFFLIEDMDYEIKQGEEADIYYSIKLKQYRNFEPKVVETKKIVTKAKPEIIIKDQFKRPNPMMLTKDIKKVFVKSGDSLWQLARLHYGDGNQYMKIATANKIATPSLIYPGQELVIP